MRKVKAYGAIFLAVVSLKLPLDAHGADMLWWVLLLGYYGKQSYERRYDLGIIADPRKAS
jgi:hypothetical protein